MIRSACAALIASTAVVGLVAPPAGATSVPASRVQALARQAQHDPRALAELEAINVVGGRRLAIGRLLAGAAGPVLKARLRTLAAGGTVAAGASSRSRRQAEAILDRPRYRGSSVPQPFHGALAWLGRQLGKPFRWLDVPVPSTHGGGRYVLIGLAAVVLGAAVLLGMRLARARGGVRVTDSGTGGRPGRSEDPASLERTADAAEEAGDLGAALRLRFRAGLLRLARARVIPARASVTTGEVRRTLGSTEFDDLARAFDEVTYGRREARRDDLERARVAWPRVVEAAVGK